MVVKIGAFVLFRIYKMTWRYRVNVFNYPGEDVEEEIKNDLAAAKKINNL